MRADQAGVSGMPFLRRVADLAAFVGRCLLDFVFPAQCCVCGASLGEDERTVCESCWGEIPVIGDERCVRCGAPSDSETDGCSNCDWRDWSFRYVRVLAPFNELVREMVHLMKYKGKRSIGLRLGSMLAAALRRDPRFGHVDLLVPVPLHRVRLKERGYNQSELLAQALGEMLDKPMRTDLLARTRYTSDQTKLDVYQRRANVAGAFRVKDERQIAGRDVALVDDVLTTGATLEACGETLFAAGARSVSVLTVASPFAEW